MIQILGGEHMLYLILVGASFHLSFKGSCMATSHIITTNLYETLFHNHYNPRFIPVCENGGKVDVKMNTALRQIMDLNEKEQILSVNIWLRLQWNDCRLRWNASDFENITHFVIPYADVWTPDITLYDSSAEEEMMPGKTDYRATVYSDGSVYYNFPTVIQSVCRVDVTHFPLDTQICSLKFGSWSYSGLELDLFPSRPSADLDIYVKHNEWSITKMPVVRSVLYYDCCPDPYPDVTFFIYMERKPLFYVMTVLFPCILTSSVASLGFILPPESGEKVALEITVLLSLAVFLLMVSEQLPASSETFPFIGMYFASSMILVSMSCFMTVLMLNVHFRGSTGSTPPKWIKKIFLDKMGWILCNKKKKYVIDKDKNGTKTTNKVVPDEETLPKGKMPNGEVPLQSVVTNVSSKDILLRSRDPVISLLRDQSKTLHKLEHHMQKEQDVGNNLNDWHILARLLDRLFLIIYLLLTFLTSLIFLVKMSQGDDSPKTVN